MFWLVLAFVVLVALLLIGQYYVLLQLRGLRRDLFFGEKKRRFKWMA